MPMSLRPRFALLGLLVLSAVIMPSTASAGDSEQGSIEWTFYNSSNNLCSSFSGGPALAYGGYGSGTEAPSGCPPEDWTGHGEGFFVSPVSGMVEFCAVADDYIDVTVNERSIIVDAGQDGKCREIRLVEGRCYELTLDFTEFSGYASFFVAWDVSGTSQPMQVEDLDQGPCPLEFDNEVHLPPVSKDEATPSNLPDTL